MLTLIHKLVYLVMLITPFHRNCYLILLGSLLLSACAVKRDSYDAPQLTMPSQYKHAQFNESGQEIDLSEWWRIFANAELDRLVDQALSNNADIRIATLRIAQAKTQANLVRTTQYPTLQGQLSSVMDRGGNKASLLANYRTDIWGEQTALFESSKYQIWRANFERDNTQRIIVTGIVSSYIEYLALNDRIRTMRETQGVQQQIMSSLEARAKLGDATSLDLSQQAAAIQSIQITLSNLEQQREGALNTLSTLLGTLPNMLSLTQHGLASLRQPSMPQQMPSGLLLQRPDIRVAEARLLAADANIDAARARILPNVDFSKQFSASLAPSAFLAPSSFFWNTIASITMQIFDAKRIANLQENAKMQYEEMLETYARTTYQAVREVENAMVGVKQTENRLKAQANISASRQEEWDSYSEMYRQSNIDYISLLNAERNLQQQQDEEQRAKMEYLQSFAMLFHTLGGGIQANDAMNNKPNKPNNLARTSTSLTQSTHAIAPQSQSVTSEGIDWGDAPEQELYWQIELSGLYTRSAIAPVWRDLRNRYPKQMGNRIVRIKQYTPIETEANTQTPLFRLYISKFEVPELAESVCQTLKANYQRCRVLSSRPKPAQKSEYFF